MNIPNPTDEPTIDIERAAELLGVSRGTAYAAANRGEIPVLRFGKRMVVPTAKLLTMLGIEEPGD